MMFMGGCNGAIGKRAKKYTVTVTETLQLSVGCVANSPEEAEEMVRSEYKSEKHVLSAAHFVGVCFSVEEESSKT
jgi:hypothetical protein